MLVFFIISNSDTQNLPSFSNNSSNATSFSSLKHIKKVALETPYAKSFYRKILSFSDILTPSIFIFSLKISHICLISYSFNSAYKQIFIITFSQNKFFVVVVKLNYKHNYSTIYFILQRQKFKPEIRPVSF